MSNPCQLTGMACDHPLCGPYQISRESGNELYNDLINLMDRRTYDGDYECCFCGNAPPPDSDKIPHEEDCLGQRLRNELFVQR